MSRENGTSYSIGNDIIEYKDVGILSGKTYSVINNLGPGWTTTGYAKIKTTTIVDYSGDWKPEFGNRDGVNRRDEAFVEFSCEGQLADVIVTLEVLNALVDCKIAEEKLLDMFDEADASSKSQFDKPNHVFKLIIFNNNTF